MYNLTRDQAAGLSFLTQQLAYIEPKMYAKKYKEITYSQIIPISTAAGEYATSINYFYMDGRAIAKFVGSKSLDVPIAEIGAAQVVIPVELGATGYEYSDEELRQAIQLNQSLDAMKADVARRAYEELVQRTSMFGNTSLGLPGFLNNVNVTAGTVIDPGGGTEWINKSPDQIIFDIVDLMGSIWTDSLQIERPNALGLPTSQYNYISNTPRSINSDTTIKQWLLTNSEWFSSPGDIIAMPELIGAGAGGTDRMIAFTRDADKVILHIPMPLRFTQPQRKGRGFEIPGEFKVGGVEFRYPGSARYADGI